MLPGVGPHACKPGTLKAEDPHGGQPSSPPNLSHSVEGCQLLQPPFSVWAAEAWEGWGRVVGHCGLATQERGLLSLQNDVEKVVVVILDKEHRPVEKFVFEITQPPLLSISSDSLLSHVEQLLRAFILKISVCDAVLDHNPPGCTFTVLVHTREAATRNMEKIQVIKDFPWILADEQDVHMHDPRLIPLKTMTSDILKMQLYVEERAHKSS
ncbi:mitotic spindle assembly checkpoint protein MAD2B [Octodon degus]|uniref:Mitotic spindle assembly checkpoint protein MAD2B n=1 Tax=Octodon degus TaxID=10160 RepID=A0A6P6D6B6_OCTDE|nr:mitotic spindle assembly checkpoint protein MAD2B [Octodon degus]